MKPQLKTKGEVIKRLKSAKELDAFVTKVMNTLTWCMENAPPDSNAYSPDKETVRGHLQAAWEGY